MTEEIPDKELRDKIRAYSLEEVTVGWSGLDTVERGGIGTKAFLAVQRVLDMISPIGLDNRGYPLANAIRYELERTFR